MLENGFFLLPVFPFQVHSTVQSAKKNCVTHKIAVWIFTFKISEEENQQQESEDFDSEETKWGFADV